MADDGGAVKKKSLLRRVFNLRKQSIRKASDEDSPAARIPEATEPQTSKLEFISLKDRPSDFGGSGVSCTSAYPTLANDEHGTSPGRLKISRRVTREGSTSEPAPAFSLDSTDTLTNKYSPEHKGSLTANPSQSEVQMRQAPAHDERPADERPLQRIDNEEGTGKGLLLPQINQRYACEECEAEDSHGSLPGKSQVPWGGRPEVRMVGPLDPTIRQGEWQASDTDVAAVSKPGDLGVAHVCELGPPGRGARTVFVDVQCANLAGSDVKEDLGSVDGESRVRIPNEEPIAEMAKREQRQGHHALAELSSNEGHEGGVAGKGVPSDMVCGLAVSPMEPFGSGQGVGGPFAPGVAELGRTSGANSVAGDRSAAHKAEHLRFTNRDGRRSREGPHDVSEPGTGQQLQPFKEGGNIVASPFPPGEEQHPGEGCEEARPSCEGLPRHDVRPGLHPYCHPSLAPSAAAGYTQAEVPHASSVIMHGLAASPHGHPSTLVANLDASIASSLCPTTPRTPVQLISSSPDTPAHAHPEDPLAPVTPVPALERTTRLQQSVDVGAPSQPPQSHLQGPGGLTSVPDTSGERGDAPVQPPSGAPLPRTTREGVPPGAAEASQVEAAWQLPAEQEQTTSPSGECGKAPVPAASGGILSQGPSNGGGLQEPPPDMGASLHDARVTEPTFHQPEYTGLTLRQPADLMLNSMAEGQSDVAGSVQRLVEDAGQGRLRAGGGPGVSDMDEGTAEQRHEYGFEGVPGHVFRRPSVLDACAAAAMATTEEMAAHWDRPSSWVSTPLFAVAEQWSDGGSSSGQGSLAEEATSPRMGEAASGIDHLVIEDGTTGMQPPPGPLPESLDAGGFDRLPPHFRDSNWELSNLPPHFRDSQWECSKPRAQPPPDRAFLDRQKVAHRAVEQGRTPGNGHDKDGDQGQGFPGAFSLIEPTRTGRGDDRRDVIGPSAGSSLAREGNVEWGRACHNALRQEETGPPSDMFPPATPRPDVGTESLWRGASDVKASRVMWEAGVAQGGVLGSTSPHGNGRIAPSQSASAPAAAATGDPRRRARPPTGTTDEPSYARLRQGVEPYSPFARQRLAGILESGGMDDAPVTAASGVTGNGQGSLRREGLHKLQEEVGKLVSSNAAERRQRRAVRQQPQGPPPTTQEALERAAGLLVGQAYDAVPAIRQAMEMGQAIMDRNATTEAVEKALLRLHMLMYQVQTVSGFSSAGYMWQAGWQVNKLGLVAERTAVFLGILQMGLHRFVKHAAAIVLQSDKYARSARNMAASMLKTLGFWLEEQLSKNGHPTLRALVLAALDDFIRAGVAPPSRLNSPDTSSLSSGPPVGEIATPDPSANLFDEGGAGEIMDSHILDDFLHDSQPLDTGPPHLSNPLLTNKSGLMTDDAHPPSPELRGPLRATLWLFKAELQDGWCAAALVISSLASMGADKVQMVGGARLVRPLFWALRNGDSACRRAAVTALQHLAADLPTRIAISKQDKHLRSLLKVLGSEDVAAWGPTCSLLRVILEQDPSSHWVLSQMGTVTALCTVLDEGLAAPASEEDVMACIFVLMSYSSNCDILVEEKGVELLMRVMQSGHSGAQQAAVRVISRLCGGVRRADCESLRPLQRSLINALQDGRKSPEIRGACAEALAAFLEGSVEGCGELLALDGVPYLIHLIQPAEAKGRKGALQALLALVGEQEGFKWIITRTSPVPAVVQALKEGGPEEQAVSMALLQVLARARSHSSGMSAHMAHMAQLEVIPLLAHVLLYGAPALRGRAAAALCNLSLEDTFVAQMGEHDVVDGLINLLDRGSPETQFAACGALYNICEGRQPCWDQEALPDLSRRLTAMLRSESWYCRLVAGDLWTVVMEEPHCVGLLGPELAHLFISLLMLSKLAQGEERELPRIAHLVVERQRGTSQAGLLLRGVPFGLARQVAAKGLAQLTSLNPSFSRLVAEEAGTSLGDSLGAGSAEERHAAAAALTSMMSSMEAREVLKTSVGRRKLETASAIVQFAPLVGLTPTSSARSGYLPDSRVSSSTSSSVRPPSRPRSSSTSISRAGSHSDAAPQVSGGSALAMARSIREARLSADLRGREQFPGRHIDPQPASSRWSAHSDANPQTSPSSTASTPTSERANQVMLDVRGSALVSDISVIGASLAGDSGVSPEAPTDRDPAAAGGGRRSLGARHGGGSLLHDHGKDARTPRRSWDAHRRARQAGKEITTVAPQVKSSERIHGDDNPRNMPACDGSDGIHRHGGQSVSPDGGGRSLWASHTAALLSYPRSGASPQKATPRQDERAPRGSTPDSSAPSSGSSTQRTYYGGIPAEALISGTAQVTSLQSPFAVLAQSVRGAGAGEGQKHAASNDGDGAGLYMTPSGALTTARSGVGSSRMRHVDTFSGTRVNAERIVGDGLGRGGLQPGGRVQRRGYAITTKASTMGLIFAQLANEDSPPNDLEGFGVTLRKQKITRQSLRVNDSRAAGPSSNKLGKRLLDSVSRSVLPRFTPVIAPRVERGSAAADGEIVIFDTSSAAMAPGLVTSGSAYTLSDTGL